MHGYNLIDANIKVAKKFDELRVSLNTIFSGYVAMEKAWRLNEEMTREIIARKEVEQKLIEAMARVEQMSIEDEMTSLRNRRGFLTLADQQIKYLREKLGFCILFADLNGLKKINDFYGHKDGDLAIKATAKVLKEALRDSDIIARLGGDEFTALISNIGPEVYPVIKQRIRKVCADNNLNLNKPWQLSISVGHFYAGTDCSLDLETMLEKADEELYEEKALYKEGIIDKIMTS